MKLIDRLKCLVAIVVFNDPATKLSNLLLRQADSALINDWLIESDNKIAGFEVSCAYAKQYRIRLNLYGGSLTRRIIDEGIYQLEHFDFVKQLLSPKDLLFVNVGANIGTSVLNAHLSGFRKFIAFEPVEKNYLFLLRNIEQIKDDSEIETHMLACGKEKSHLPLHLNETVWGKHSFKKDFGYKSQETQIIDLDSMKIKEKAFLYLDTEGFELEILRGAKETLKNVMGICTEVTPRYITNSELEEMRLVINTNFSLHIINGKLVKRPISKIEIYNKNKQFDIISFK